VSVFRVRRVAGKVERVHLRYHERGLQHTRHGSFRPRRHLTQRQRSHNTEPPFPPLKK
jgi:hypothetical protein